MTTDKIKRLWSEAVINKQQKEILNLYCNNALFKGTMMKKPSKGKREIITYFKNFSPKVNNITFQKSPVIVKNGELINEFGVYKFYTTEGIIKANYSFVFKKQDRELKILSHFSCLLL